MTTKKYLLLKDTPNTKSETIFYLNGDKYYPFQKPDGGRFELHEAKGETFYRGLVENSPEWFEEVKGHVIKVNDDYTVYKNGKQIKWSDEDVIAFAKFYNSIDEMIPGCDPVRSAFYKWTKVNTLL